ncbi:hypothetical protein [Fusobacterium sp.]|uniref:hypothetical protein n=1 Tax=Fusobacterium sp. TaxID=68766 RepID=UPI00290244BF|nr:hypothetical protein [Fusobacterium sp.]MDU1910193.1 hypothetical protein [Fusobacterium sp.]
MNLTENYKYMIRILDGKEKYEGKEYDKVIEKYLYNSLPRLEEKRDELKLKYPDKEIEIREKKEKKWEKIILS